MKFTRVLLLHLYLSKVPTLKDGGFGIASMYHPPGPEWVKAWNVLLQRTTTPPTTLLLLLLLYRLPQPIINCRHDQHQTDML